MSQLLRLLPYLSLLTQIASVLDAINGTGAVELRPSVKGKKLSIVIRRTDLEPQMVGPVTLGHPNIVGQIASVATQILPGIKSGPAPVFSHA